MHKTTYRFNESFKTMPIRVQKVATRNFELFNVNPHHPSLHFKKIGKFWSLRIGLNYRALAIKENARYTWVWIGTHDNYLKMLKRE
jgi:hypothetical protein